MTGAEGTANIETSRGPESTRRQRTVAAIKCGLSAMNHGLEVAYQGLTGQEAQIPKRVSYGEFLERAGERKEFSFRGWGSKEVIDLFKGEAEKGERKLAVLALGGGQAGAVAEWECYRVCMRWELFRGQMLYLESLQEFQALCMLSQARERMDPKFIVRIILQVDLSDCDRTRWDKSKI